MEVKMRVKMKMQMNVPETQQPQGRIGAGVDGWEWTISLEEKRPGGRGCQLFHWAAAAEGLWRLQDEVIR